MLLADKQKQTEADLGMFSMFGRTGGPPQKHNIFFHFSYNMVTSQKY